MRDSEGKCIYYNKFKDSTNYSLKLVDEMFRCNANLQLFDNELRPFLKLVSLKLTQQLLFPIFLKLGTFNCQKLNLEDKLLLSSPGLGLEKYLIKSPEFKKMSLII